MINGGNATIFVADMEKSIHFYTEILQLELRFRAENHWAEVQAGDTLVIGLHPASPNVEEPGTAGAIQLGLTVDEPLEEIQRRLSVHGVNFLSDIVDDGPGRFARFKDPDGNILYFWQSNPPATGGTE